MLMRVDADAAVEVHCDYRLLFCFHFFIQERYKGDINILKAIVAQQDEYFLACKWPYKVSGFKALYKVEKNKVPKAGLVKYVANCPFSRLFLHCADTKFEKE